MPTDILFMVLGSLAGYFTAPYALRWWQTHNRPGRPSREARALLADDDYSWTDSLVARGGTIHIDPRGEGHLLLLPRHGRPSIVGFGDVQEWGYSDLRSGHGHHTGWRFRVATSDPRNALTTLDIRGVDTRLPDLWTAKLGAYVNRAPRLRRGIGLIEIAMGLGIASLIVAAALAYFANANESRKVRDTLSEAMAIHTTVQGLYGGQPDKADLDTATVAKSGQLQSSYVTANGTGLTNPYKGAVYVYGSAGYPGFDMLFTGLSRTGCQQVGIGAFQMGSALVQVVINPSPGIPSSGGYGSYGLEPAAWAAGVRQHCDQPGNGNVVRFSTAR